MQIDEYSNKLNEICTSRGWKIILELDGIWEVVIYDKKTGKKLGETGSVDLSGILIALTIPFTDSNIWST
jgi:hypothetical protein